MANQKPDQDRVTLDVFNVRLYMDAVITMNQRGEIVTVKIFNAGLGLLVAMDPETQQPVAPKEQLDLYAQRLTDNENPIIRQVLHAASVAAMPKGDEKAIVLTHLDEQPPSGKPN